MSSIVRGLVNHLTEVGGLEPDIAKKHIDADCKKGIIVFREASPVINLDEEAGHTAPSNRVRLIQKDYVSGDFGVLEAARGRSEFKDFSWDALMLEANAEHKTRG